MIYTLLLKGNGGALLEGNRRAAKCEEKNDIKESVRCRLLLHGWEP
jgi:hypothetical protein